MKILNEIKRRQKKGANVLKKIDGTNRKQIARG